MKRLKTRYSLDIVNCCIISVRSVDGTLEVVINESVAKSEYYFLNKYQALYRKRFRMYAKAKFVTLDNKKLAFRKLIQLIYKYIITALQTKLTFLQNRRKGIFVIVHRWLMLHQTVGKILEHELK